MTYERTASPAIRGLNLSVAAGSRVALVGANGAGKSTLLKTIAGLLSPVGGSVEALGGAIEHCHHLIAYLPQRGELDWRFPLSVRRLVLTGRYVHLGWLRRPGSGDWHAVDSALARMGIQGLGDQQIGELSGGQQQRALLARALAQDAQIYLLDEPLNAVDRSTRRVLADVLDDLRELGRTVLVATHDIGRLDAEFDDAVFLAEGARVATPSDAAHGRVAAPLHH